MRSFILLLVIIAILPASVVRAQKVKLTQSSSTSWSGGIAGRYGTGYNFTVEFSGYKGKKEPVPDTIWLGNKRIPLKIKVGTEPQSFNAVRTEGKKSVSYLIICGTSWEDAPKPGQPASKNEAKPVPPMKYSGIGLLSYKYNGRQRYFVIDRVMEQKPPVNYP